MSGAYRESAAVTRVPLEEMAWRRRVGRGAGWLPIFLLLGPVAGMTWGVLSLPHLGLTAVLWSAHVGVAASTWMLTAVQPGRRADWLTWVLRGSAIATVVSALLASQWGILRALNLGSSLVITAAGLAYVARLFDLTGDARRGRQARVLIVPVVAGPVFVGWMVGGQSAWMLLPTSIMFVSLLWGFVLLWRLRRRTSVLDHYWWLDDAAATPGEWVSVLVYKDGHAEVIAVDGQLGCFVSQDEAYDWLEQNGYVWGKAAVEDGLVVAQPPDLLPAKA